MLNHEYIVMQMSKVHQQDLLRERQNDRLAQIAAKGEANAHQQNTQKQAERPATERK
jgi:hypothetical protein